MKKYLIYAAVMAAVIWALSTFVFGDIQTTAWAFIWLTAAFIVAFVIYLVYQRRSRTASQASRAANRPNGVPAPGQPPATPPKGKSRDWFAWLDTLQVARVLKGSIAILAILILIVCFAHPIQTTSRVGSVVLSWFQPRQVVVNGASVPVIATATTSYVAAPQITYERCADFSAEHQTCAPTGPSELDIPSALANKPICWDAPFQFEAGEKLMIHTMDGQWRDYRPNEEAVLVNGYRFTPAPGHPRSLTYWLAESSCLT